MYDSLEILTIPNYIHFIMGVDIIVHRCRIGLFNLCKRQKPRTNKHYKRYKNTRYTSHTSGSDVQFRVFIMCILLGTQIILAELLMLMIRNCPSTLYVENDDQYRGLADVSHGFGTVTTPYTLSGDCQYTYLGLSQRLLILSADVETNPDPVTDMETILEEIRSSKTELLEEMKNVKSDIKFAAIKTDNSVTKTNVTKLQNKQTEFEKKLKDIQSELDIVNGEKETLLLDVDALMSCITKWK